MDSLSLMFHRLYMWGLNRIFSKRDGLLTSLVAQGGLSWAANAQPRTLISVRTWHNVRAQCLQRRDWGGLWKGVPHGHCCLLTCHELEPGEGSQQVTWRLIPNGWWKKGEHPIWARCGGCSSAEAQMQSASESQSSVVQGRLKAVSSPTCSKFPVCFSFFLELMLHSPC